MSVLWLEEGASRPRRWIHGCRWLVARDIHCQNPGDFCDEAAQFGKQAAMAQRRNMAACTRRNEFPPGQFR